MNKNMSVEYSPSSSSDVLFVSFGSVTLDESNHDIPPFAFKESLKGLNANVLFIRDVACAWYQAGLKGVSNKTMACIRHVKFTIKCTAPRKVVCIGGSMGGHGAILYGNLIGADEVHAFCPQIIIEEEPAIKLKDVLLKYYRANVYPKTDDQPHGRKYLDLKRLLDEPQRAETVNHIYYGLKHKKDVYNANHVKDCHNVFLHGYKGVGHMVASHLRQTGELKNIINGAIA